MQWPAFILRLAAPCLGLVLSAAGVRAAGTLAITAPGAGARLASHTVLLRAAATGFTPSAVEFYDAGGAYLGRAAAGPAGLYEVSREYRTNGVYTVQAVTPDGSVASPLVSFAVDDRTGPTALAVLAPANGERVTTYSVTLRAAATNYQPSRVEFYEGSPSNTSGAAYLGASYRNPDGGYAVDHDFRYNGVHSIFVLANDGFADVVSPGVTFTIDNRTGPTALTMAAPANGAIVTTRDVKLTAAAANFVPQRVEFYDGDPAAPGQSAYLGASTQPATDGTWSYIRSFYSDGAHSVYAETTDGFNTVRSAAVRFTVVTNLAIRALTVDPNPACACGSATGTLTLAAPAPAGGAAFALESDTPSVAFAPGSVTVPEGLTSVTFPVTLGPVRVTRTAILTASGNGTHATVTLPVTPAPQYPYRIVDLGTLGGQFSSAAGINASGQVTGHAQTADALGHAFRTDSAGRMEDVDPRNPRAMLGYAINAAGQVVGLQYDAGSSTFVTSAAGMAFLAGPGWKTVIGTAINDWGSVAGYGDFTDGLVHPFVASAEGELSDLGLPSGATEARLFGLNAAGRAVGDARLSAGRRAIAAPPGGPVALMATLGGDSAAYAVNAQGTAAGASRPAGATAVHLARWGADGQVVGLGTLGDLSVEGRGINGAGAIVGASYIGDPFQGGTLQHAIRFVEGDGIRDLNTLIDPAAGWTLKMASGINDAGQIAGYGQHHGDLQAFRLDPVALDILFGDADLDGSVTLKDATAILRAASGLAGTADLERSDVAPSPSCAPGGVGDGRLTLADAIRVLRHVRLEEALP